MKQLENSSLIFNNKKIKTKNKSMAAPADVTVSPGSPLYITDTNNQFGTVTVNPGGQIFVQTTAKISIASLVKVTAMKAANAFVQQTTGDINIFGTPGTPGVNGASGPNGNNGINGQNASCNWASGCNDGSSGTSGAIGGNGGDASNGS